MSWSFKIIAKSKTGALNSLAKKAEQQSGLPSNIAAVISAQIEALPDGPVHVESSGHLDPTYGGNASFTLNQNFDVVD